ncbi:uncharacterized protein LOC143231037 isoform X2 [Tachypleus tridentatus]|uniref:uncharacterized protein LOC143231037 isoform X2 n=1 Tax=Tachypleus tridentatus TaxID=6853 RepID=UPI003FD26CAC
MLSLYCCSENNNINTSLRKCFIDCVLLYFLCIHIMGTVKVLYSQASGQGPTNVNNEENDVKNGAEQLYSEFWQWRLQESPEFSSLIGNHMYDDKLDSYSLEAFRKRKNTAEQFLQKSEELVSQLESGTSDLNMEMLISGLQTYVDGMELLGYFFPINRFEGVQLDFEVLIDSYMKFESVDDFTKLISRYRAFPQQAEEIIELMREGIHQGRTNHAVSMKYVLEQFGLLQKPAELSPFFKPFLSMPSSVMPLERETLKSEAKNVIARELLPSFQKLRNFIEKEYMAATRPNIAVSSLPDGEKLYRKCLHFHTSTHMTPEEIHNIGLQEVERISAEINEVIKSTGSNLSKQDFFEKLRTDPQFYFETKKELLNAFKDIIENQIKPKISDVFKNIPQVKLEVVPAPISMSEGVQAYYKVGSEDGSKPGKFFINVADLSRNPKYEMMSVSLHEGEPGHHLQESFTITQKDIPAFRRFIEDRKFSDSPSRFPLYTAYNEGWALYSEYLGVELGLFKEPYFLLGRLSEEICRACRLVVDTGIHAFRWSRKKAVNYLLENTSYNIKNIENEIDRYITWPGEVCSYKIGELKIKELRKRAEKELGNKFDIKDFHDLILRNHGPLTLLEKQVDIYIQQHWQQ